MVTLYMTSLLMTVFAKNWKVFSTALTITGAIKGTSPENPYKQLRLESLKLRR